MGDPNARRVDCLVAGQTYVAGQYLKDEQPSFDAFVF